MSDAVAPEGRIFHTLDALRGIAAIGVVVFHMSPLFRPIAAPGGYLAVDLFFMMSGVVLSHAYEARFRAGMGTFNFMRARVIRLYPLYLAGTLFGLAVTLASWHGRNSQHWDPSSLVRAVLLALVVIPNLSARPVNTLFPLDIPCWSLFFEILVNLLYVILWPLLSSRRLLFLCLLNGAWLSWAIVQGGSLDQGSAGSSFGVGLVRTAFGFSVGVLIARLIPRVRRGQSDLAVLAMVAVVAIAIAGSPQQDYRALWDATCVLIVFPVVVFVGTLIDPRSRLRKAATFLGLTSYAIYVLHSPLSSVLNSGARFFASRGVAGMGAPYAGIGVLAVSLAGCWLVDRYFDMPIRRQLNRIIPKMKGLRAQS